jgi:hypothetical protein
MLLMLGPVVASLALIATTTRLKSPATAVGPARPRLAPPNPFRPVQWSSRIKELGTTCGRCGKSIHEPAGGAAEVMLVSLLNFSDSLEYPCKSCGQVYCLDCMTVLKTSGSCPGCGRAIGW